MVFVARGSGLLAVSLLKDTSSSPRKRQPLILLKPMSITNHITKWMSNHDFY